MLYTHHIAKLLKVSDHPAHCLLCDSQSGRQLSAGDAIALEHLKCHAVHRFYVPLTVLFKPAIKLREQQLERHAEKVGEFQANQFI